jgi:hypothetical protein
MISGIESNGLLSVIADSESYIGFQLLLAEKPVNTSLFVIQGSRCGKPSSAG